MLLPAALIRATATVNTKLHLNYFCHLLPLRVGNFVLAAALKQPNGEHGYPVCARAIRNQMSKALFFLSHKSDKHAN